MADRLVASERQQSLIRIPKWEEEGDGDAIKREFVFKGSLSFILFRTNRLLTFQKNAIDFKEAWAWMTTVAQEADQVNNLHIPSHSDFTIHTQLPERF